MSTICVVAVFTLKASRKSEILFVCLAYSLDVPLFKQTWRTLTLLNYSYTFASRSSLSLQPKWSVVMAAHYICWESVHLEGF